MIITFSGLDGSGKSTLIKSLRRSLEQRKCRVTVLTMYDHIGIYALIRQVRDRIKTALGCRLPSAGSANAYSNDPDRIGAAQARPGVFMGPLLKLFRSRPAKRLIYCFDLSLLMVYRVWLEYLLGRVLILDRYFYDSLADVADGRHWLFIRSFLRLAPKPDAPIFIDVPPEEAFRRKPEYPIDYMQRRRDLYVKIFSWVERPIILRNDDLEFSRRHLEEVVSRRIGKHARRLHS